MKNKLARYTIEIPIRFSFNGSADLDAKTLMKMAESYADLVTKQGTGINYFGIKLVEKVDISETPQEVVERILKNNI
jgi:hypothetical protein